MTEELDERLISPFASGTDHLDKTSVYAQSKRFVVFRIEAHRYWNGRWSPPAYARLRHVLIHKGQFCIGNDIREWEGRVTKAVAQEIQEALQKSEKTGKIGKGR